MKRIVSFVVLIIVVLLAIFLLKASKTTQSAGKPVSLLFVGDIMLSRQIESIIYKEQDPLFPFLRMADIIRGADVAFANLENPVSRRGENVGSIYSFRANPDFLKGLSYAGFDVVSVANNHTFDWGKDAFLDTISNLENEGIDHVGGGANILEARKPVIIKKEGTKIAYLGYSEFASKEVASGTPAIAPLDLKVMKEDIAKAKAIAPNIVVSIHWGTEYATTSSPEQKDIAHALVDAGATIVIGHHPHVIQELERYHGGLIAYSLGNFVFDQNFSEDTKRGMILHVVVDSRGIKSYRAEVVNFTDEFQPYVSATAP